MGCAVAVFAHDPDFGQPRRSTRRTCARQQSDDSYRQDQLRYLSTAHVCHQLGEKITGSKPARCLLFHQRDCGHRRGVFGFQILRAPDHRFLQKETLSAPAKDRRPLPRHNRSLVRINGQPLKAPDLVEKG